MFRRNRSFINRAQAARRIDEKTARDRKWALSTEDRSLDDIKLRDESFVPKAVFEGKIQDLPMSAIFFLIDIDR